MGDNEGKEIRKDPVMRRYVLKLFTFAVTITFAACQLTKCEQKSPKVNVDALPQNPDKYFELSIESNNRVITQENKQYLPDQTYLIRLRSNNDFHPFKWFMITVENPDENSVNERDHMDVGSLKLLSNQSRYSERCSNSIEETDNSDKYKIEVHWLSPRQSDGKNVRVRAMVAENNEVWYEGGNLIFDIEKNVQRQPDAPPHAVLEKCPLCSEARYERYRLNISQPYILLTRRPPKDWGSYFKEVFFFAIQVMKPPILRYRSTGLRFVLVISYRHRASTFVCQLDQITFQGKWSRLTHPRHFPTKPYETGYSAMIGASHGLDFELWKIDTEANAGLQLLAEYGNITGIQEYIIRNIHQDYGVRTLIKGKGHFHPRMFESSYALFRVDHIHHLFSILVALRPSPDWFLGTSDFELCTKDGWLEENDMPLYPWDAGTANGVSYESHTSASKDLIGRVKLGSLDPASPFYQVNLDDLKPFAMIHVRRLDVYPITDGTCGTDEEEGASNSNIVLDKNNDDFESPSADEAIRDSVYYGVEEPMVMESKPAINCMFTEWGDWSPCEPLDGICGVGRQTRFRYKDDTNINIRYFSRDLSDGCNCGTGKSRVNIDESRACSESSARSPQLVDCSLTSLQFAANDAPVGRVLCRVRSRTELRNHFTK
ncbi:Spondin-1 [Eumeta japonica]|uniref:Spondin-1 n=1 Tax=Eumeta variegata TaxID=151549 RepID=A0A4C1SBC0_EUMVA|nr:Spondin-1 [Eumeta japonica]